MMDDARSATAEGLLSVPDAAQQAGVSRATINRWVRRGHLVAVTIDGRRHIRSDILATSLAITPIGGVVLTWRRDRQRAGMRLRALREAAGLTQVALVAASGVTREAISRLESGQTAPRAETVRALAQALEVAPERFVGHDPVGLAAVTVAEAAARLEVPVGRVRRWLRAGRLSGIRVCRQWRVPGVAIDELARSGQLRGRSHRLDSSDRG